jgi:hypothetical protein
MLDPKLICSGFMLAAHTSLLKLLLHHGEGVEHYCTVTLTTESPGLSDTNRSKLEGDNDCSMRILMDRSGLPSRVTFTVSEPDQDRQDKQIKNRLPLSDGTSKYVN